jgi:hypothetical protein
VDELAEFDKIAGGDFGRRARVGPERSGGRAAVPGREQSHPKGEGQDRPSLPPTNRGQSLP